MKVLCFAPYALVSPHFETDLELAQRHLEAGDQVTFIRCNGEMLACDYNLGHTLAGCITCTGRQTTGMAALRGAANTRPLMLLTPKDRAELAALGAPPTTLEALRALRVEDLDLGEAAFSSLVSALRDPRPDLVEHRGLLARLLTTALAVYRSTQNHLDQGGFDRVYLFNGRFSSLRACLRACQNRGVQCFTHERGANLNRYSLFENASLHDRDNFRRLIQAAWDAANPSERTALGARFYELRARGVIQNWHSFTSAQQRDALPPGLDQVRHPLAVFLSSEDEFVAVGPAWTNPVYASQLDGLQQLERSLGAQEGHHIFVRVHPNLKGINNSFTRQLAGLKSRALTIIPAESPVDSYALARTAGRVLTFGSTMGIEASYWGLPSILAGMSLYRGLGGTYEPRTHQEVVDLCLRPDLPPLPQEPALRYGHYLQTFGTPFRYFVPRDVFCGAFNGRTLEPSRVANKLTHWLGRRELAPVASLVDRASARVAHHNIRSGGLW